MEKEKKQSADSSISIEERNFLVKNNKFSGKTIEEFDKQMKDVSSSFKIDSALKRLYMALIIH